MEPTSDAAPVAAPAELPPQPVVVPPGYELPTARQVVGRGLQLAYDSTRDIRRGSVYIGLLLLATVGPFLALLLATIPQVSTIDFTAPQDFTPAQQEQLLGLIGPLYVAGVLAAIGLIAVAIDSSLIAVGILAGRAVGRPLTLLEATARSRQVYWRYGVAAFVVGVISGAVALALRAAGGSLASPASLGEQLLASFVGAIVVLPFSYIATAVVIGDVGGLAALGRSATLVRARLRLGVTVAAFAFASGALQTFGLSAGLGIVGEVATFLHVQLDLTGPGLVAAMVLGTLGIVALGSLLFTVQAIAVSPQVTAFLGLTHYDAGLDRARTPASAALEPVAEQQPAETAPDPAPATAPVSAWAQPIERSPGRTRWVTLPMVGLIVIEILVAVAGLVSILSLPPGGAIR